MTNDSDRGFAGSENHAHEVDLLRRADVGGAQSYDRHFEISEMNETSAGFPTGCRCD